MENSKGSSDLNTGIESLVRHLKDYSETRYNLMVINFQDKLSDIVSTMTSILIIGILLLFTLFFLSLGAAWYIGQITGNASTGFFIVGGLYFVMVALIYLLREKLIHVPMINLLLKKISTNEAD